MPGADTPYRGRFAPSPTGPLHLGSLIAALASYLDARSAGGEWLVRMEDLDPPREEAGAADSILRSLEAHGLTWDGSVLYQSTRNEAYDAALARLENSGNLFACDCTRAQMGPYGSCCGHCRERLGSISEPCALRVPVRCGARIDFTDALQGPQRSALAEQLPDFVVRRKDQLYAYQLAVVVDDGDQGVTHIVRGSDLLDSTARQIYLQGLLGYATPDYLHFPVITNDAGQKFSKQNHAPPVDDEAAAYNLRRALRFLQQANPPADLLASGEILKFSVQHWQAGSLPQGLAVPAGNL